MPGRIRTIKPELEEDDRTAGLSANAYRLFIGLILAADDYGNLRASPEQLHGKTFWKRPLAELRSECTQALVLLLVELIQAGLLAIYEVRGQLYGALHGWSKHQRIDHPSKPMVPGPSDTAVHFTVQQLCKQFQIDVEHSRDLSRDRSRESSIPSRVESSRNEPNTIVQPAPAEPQKPPAAPAVRVFSKDLEEVYALYPRREGKTRGMAKVQAIAKAGRLAELRQAVEAYAAKVRRDATEQRYVKLFSSFMGCWEDYLPQNAGPSQPFAPPAPVATVIRLPVISPEEKAQVRSIVGDLAARLAGRAGGVSDPSGTGGA